MKHYIIVESYDINELSRVVNVKLKAGYVPTGGPFQTDNTLNRLGQAMVREIPLQEQ